MRRMSLVLMVVGTAVVAQSSAEGQSEKDQTTVTGKLVSLEKKGRSTVLTVETSSKEKQEFAIDGRVELVITAKGDVGFLTAGQLIETTAIMSNDLLFGKDFVVHAAKGGKKPPARLEKAPPKSGQSLNAYAVCGTVVSRQPDADYKDRETVILRIGGKKARVFLDKQFTVSVFLNDPSLVKPGDDVVVEGSSGAGGRFTLSSATIKLAEPLKAEEFLPDKGRAKKSKDS